jgi:hypothetical protein
MPALRRVVVDRVPLGGEATERAGEIRGSGAQRPTHADGLDARYDSMLVER